MRTLATWVLTVFSETKSSAAISPFESPRAIMRSTSFSREDSCSSPRAAPAGARAANSSMSRRVTLGAKSAPPSATTRTAVTSRSSGASLRRKPLAPARSAS